MAITEHVWGILAGLTKPTNQTYIGQKLLVFETWQTKMEFLSLRYTTGLEDVPKIF
jgi:hypothetical protein